MKKKDTLSKEQRKPKSNEFKVVNSALLMEFLMQKMNGISRSKIKAILAGNGVSVDKKIVTQYDFKLQPEMIVSISKRKKKEDLRSPFVKLVYEDRWIIVIDKSPGVMSMGVNPRQFCVKTVLDQYLSKDTRKKTAHVVHRLDRDTSGLMIYAKDFSTAKILEEYWREIVYDRRYVAVVDGVINEKEGKVESWLKESKNFVMYSSPTDNGGKFAVTQFCTLKNNSKHTLIELKLQTGRKNQIRVHMQDIGHPITGDIKYGNSVVGASARLALHAYKLNFYHPITKEIMQFELPIPREFTLLVD